MEKRTLEEDVTRNLARLKPKLIEKGLIGSNSLDETGKPFEKAINFIQILSIIMTEDSTNMTNFMNVLSKVKINPENLRDFTDKVKQLRERDEELITQLGEEYLTIAVHAGSFCFFLFSFFSRESRTAC